ncbi:MAG: type IX secretion system membrane protein PorP/SprF [Cyclobacteriaceae bacterium]|nr:type IX secretion system membrane protein PorP/SprF [Cyclobacteriaceae bacterium]
MKKPSKYIFILIVLLQVINGYSQQQVMFTQYMFNNLAINPAYAGHHGHMSATALVREQWTGLDGAPSTQTFSIHTPITKQRFSLGALFVHDKIGVTEQTGTYLSYAYRIPLSEKGKLSFGLQGGITHYNAQFSVISSTNPIFANGDISEIHPNVGFGLFYNTDKFYAGLSTPQLMETVFDKENPDSESIVIRHYFLSSGYVFDLGNSLKLKPNILVKAVNGAPVQIDLNANLLINHVIWVGLSWRSFDSVDALLQLQLTDQLQLGYAYDFITTTDLRHINTGSHEFMLNYQFSFAKTRVITPRYF